MKKTFWLLVAAAIILFSCKKEKPAPQPAPETFFLNVSTPVVKIPAAAGIISTVNIESNSDWNIAIANAPDWMQVNKTSGKGNGSIQIITTENTGAPRTVTMTVSLANGKTEPKQITIEQEGSLANTIALDWKKVLGGSGNDYGYTIIKTPDGGYLVSGRTSSNNNGDVGATKGGLDMWVVKLTAAGSMAWQKTFGGTADDIATAAAPTPDGGYVVTGYTISNNNGDVGVNHGGVDFWVIKLNSNGALQWQKTLGGSAEDWPFAINITSEGKIVVAGYTRSNNSGDVGANHGAEDMWIVMLENTNGAAVWQKTIGGSGSEIARAVVPAEDGGFYVGGTATSNNNGDVPATKGAGDFLVMKMDKNGGMIWKKTYGGSNIEELNGLALAPNNVLVAVGSTKSNNNGDVGPATGSEDYWIINLNTGNGALNWQKTLGGQSPDAARTVFVKANGSIIVAGYVYSTNTGDVTANPGNGDFWIVQLSAAGNLMWKKALGGDGEDIAFSMADGGNGPVIAGYTLSNKSGDVGDSHGNSDVWVVKLKDQ